MSAGSRLLVRACEVTVSLEQAVLAFAIGYLIAKAMNMALA